MTARAAATGGGLSVARRIGLAIAALAIVLAGTAGLGGLFCRLRKAIDPTTLPTGRIVYLIIDPTASLQAFAERTRSLAAERVLARLVPGDFIDALEVGSDVDRYDEGHDRLFIDADRLPAMVTRPRQVVTPDDLCPSRWCDRNRAFRETFAKELTRLDDLRSGWRATLDRMRPPRNKCCSGYLQVFQFVEQNAAGQSGERWLIVIGDLIHEGSKLPPAELGDSAPPSPFSGFKVLLAHPSGAQDTERSEAAVAYWSTYFESRGAQVTVSSFEHFAGLPASPLAPPPAPAVQVAHR